MRSLLLYLVIALLLTSGCTGVNHTSDKPSFTLSSGGNISIHIPPPEVTSVLMKHSGNISVEEVTFMTFSGNVSSVLVSPENPKAAIVWAPGAGVPAAGHIEHLIAYGEAGYAVLVLDIRGNGGKTPGSPLNLEADYEKLISGSQWPQVYLIVSDLVSGEMYLHKRFGALPVWAVGESNGGRYAAQAVAVDPNFYGYVGISTSGFGHQGDQYEGVARDFLLSVDPEALAGHITPRASFIFHAAEDPIIPISAGEKLAGCLGPSSQFYRFKGTHGVNGEVDEVLIARLYSESA